MNDRPAHPNVAGVVTDLTVEPASDIDIRDNTFTRPSGADIPPHWMGTYMDATRLLEVDRVAGDSIVALALTTDEKGSNWISATRLVVLPRGYEEVATVELLEGERVLGYARLITTKESARRVEAAASPQGPCARSAEPGQPHSWHLAWRDERDYLGTLYCMACGKVITR